MEKKKIRAIVRDISYSPSKRMAVFRSILPKRQPKIFRELSRHVQKSLVMQLNDAEMISILERMDPNEAADILRLVPVQKQKKLIEEVNTQMSSNINMLLSFEPNTAAHLMSLDYVLADKKDSIRTIFEKVDIHEKRTGKFPIVLVAEDHRLLGYIPGYKLGLAKLNETAFKYVKKIATLSYDTGEKKVLKFFMKNPHAKVVVLGKNENVLGIIFSDDIIRLLRKQESASLYNFAGVSDEESIFDTVRRKVEFRYKWLILNLGTAFLAAMTVSLFESTIAKNVLLAVYMPIVAGMGGNAGTQTLAVMVRGMAFNKLGWKEIKITLRNEIMAGFLNGLMNGLIVFTIVLLVNKNIMVASVLGVAMIINLMVSGTFGTLVPVLMKKLKKDPASSATIFITTATDVLGFLAFLGLATLILR